MNKDYVSAHLSWLKSHPTFQTHLYDNIPPYSSYEQMKMWYDDIQRVRPDLLQSLARSNLEKDLKSFMGINDLVEQMKSEIKAAVKTRRMYFVTIGFNHQDFDLEKAKALVDHINNLPWIKAFKANFEYHRTNGIHPHIHYLLLVDDLAKSKVVEYLWSVRGIKKLVVNKQSIDVRIPNSSTLNYIQLIKAPEKMECVEKDKVWRKENQIPDYEKNVADLGI